MSDVVEGNHEGCPYDEKDEAEQEAEEGNHEGCPYRMMEWKGLPMWQCRLCPWSTLEGEAEMMKHLAEVHSPKPTARGFVLADRRGRPVE